MQPIGEKDLFTITHYEYGEAYFGSSGKMSFRVAREPLVNVHFIPADKRGPGKLLATVWPGPYNYAVTDDAKKVTREFEFSEEGLGEVVVWLNEKNTEMNADGSDR